MLIVAAAIVSGRLGRQRRSFMINLHACHRKDLHRMLLYSF